MFTTRTPAVRGAFWKNLALVLLLDGTVSLEALAVPSGPDVTISAYDVPVDPVGLSFGTDGALFVGRDNAGSGGGNADPVRIHRIAPGGGSHAEYGLVATPDPDAVFFDGTGVFSGVAGSVIVGGHPAGSATGKISAIRPNESVVTLWGPNATFVNPSDFLADASGRLLFTDFETSHVFQTTGGAPAILFSPGVRYREISLHPSTGDLYLRNSESHRINIYNASGVFQSTFSSGIDGTGMDFGRGGSWGNSLYVGSTTRLLRVNGPASQDTIATGFTRISDIEFGPDESMYVSDIEADTVYRLTPTETSVEELGSVSSPAAFALGHFAPNPFTADTQIEFALPERGYGRVAIYDVTGREVAIVVSGVQERGLHRQRWNGAGRGGVRLSSGTYFARLEFAGREVTRKIVIAR
jgi:hypothetical protein